MPIGYVYDVVYRIAFACSILQVELTYNLTYSDNINDVKTTVIRPRQQERSTDSSAGGRLHAAL